MNKTLILVVEDDPPVRNLITTTLRSNDYRYLVAGNGETAMLEASSAPSLSTEICVWIMPPVVPA